MKITMRKIITFTVVFVMILQVISSMTLITYASTYDITGDYQPETAWGGRASNSVISTVGEKMYAYVGRMTVGTDLGGLTVLDTTNPESPVEVQSIDSITFVDSSWTNEKMFIRDNCLFVLNKNTQRLERYRINESDGTIKLDSKWQSEEGYTTGTIKVVDDLMFVSAVSINSRNLGLASLNIYDISDALNPVKLTTETPIQPTMEKLNQSEWEVTEQIATFSVSVVRMGSNKYRLFGTNRAKFGDVIGNQYFLSIRDITITDGTYTVKTLYEGQPEGTVFETNGNSVYDIDALNANIIAVVEGGTGDSVSSLEIINVSEPASPVKITDNGLDTSGVGAFVDKNTIILSTKGPRMYVYTYAGNTLTQEKEIIPKNTPYEVGVYSGFMYAAVNNGFELYEYSNSISFDIGMTEGVNTTIKGTVEGYLPATDKVIVSVGKKDYLATVSANRFSVETDELTAGEYVAKAKLLRNIDGNPKELATTPEITISVTQSTNPENIIKLGSIPTYSNGARVTDAVSLTVGNKQYLYTTYANTALVVYDITDVSDYSKLTPYQECTDILTGIFNSQLKIKDGYLFVSQTLPENNRNVLMCYKIGSDGKLPVESKTVTDETTQVSTSVKVTVGTKIANGSSNKLDTIEIVDDYLFYAQQNTGGDCDVYDISDIENGVTLLGSTSANYGVFALEVEKISDSLYRLYYISRTDLMTNGNKPGFKGYQFNISDMSIDSDGTVNFVERYKGIDAFSDYANIPAVKDIELIGENKIFMVCATDSSSAATHRFIIDAKDPEQPEVTNVSNSVALSVQNINNNYYAVGTQGGTIAFYKKSDNALVKEFTGLGQVYGMSIYDGKMYASVQGDISIFHLFITVTSTINKFSVVKLEVTDKDGFLVNDVAPGDLTATAQIYNPDNTTEKVYMLLAAYSSITDELVWVQAKDFDVVHGLNSISDTIRMESLSNYSPYTQYMKVFVWKDDMSPLTESYKVREAELVDGSIWEMYIPENTQTVQGVVLINHHGMGLTLSSMNAFKSFCADRGLAIMSFFDDAGVLKNFTDKETATAAILSKLDEFAIKTGHPELSKVPLATFGHSNATAFSAGFAEYNNERVFASIVYKSARDDQFEYNTFGEYNIPIFVITGEFDWGYGYNGQIFASERLLEKGAFIQYIQDPNSGHFWNDYKSNTIMFEFLDRAYDLKISNSTVDEDGNTIMTLIDKTKGYIGYGEYTVTDSDESYSGYAYKFVPTGYMTYEEYLELKSENPDFKAHAWLFDEEYAKDWVEFNKNGIIDVEYAYKD